jgi:hypothetical protein
MDRDQAAVVGDPDLACADPRVHPQPDQCDRDRVTVLADRDHRLAVDPRRGLLGAVEALGRQRAQPAAFELQRLSDRDRPPTDRAREVLPASLSEALVELGQRVDLGDRNQVAPAETSDPVALDAALLVRAALPAQAKARREHVVRAQRDEAIGLDAPAAP